MRMVNCLFDLLSALHDRTESSLRQKGRGGGEGSVYAVHKGKRGFCGGFCVTVIQTHSKVNGAFKSLSYIYMAPYKRSTAICVLKLKCKKSCQLSGW